MTANQTVKLPYETALERTEAAQFVAELVRQGVTFEATAEALYLVINFTGGY